MGLIYITGVAGTGKSAVREELLKRGYTAYGTDEDGISRWFAKSSGRMIDDPTCEVYKTASFRQGHEWRMCTEQVRKIAQETSSHTAFLCGTGANEAEVWDCFSKVIYLLLDESTLRVRLAERTSNDFGQEPHELAEILQWLKWVNDNHGRLGVKTVDASKPLTTVVDEILSISADSQT